MNSSLPQLEAKKAICFASLPPSAIFVAARLRPLPASAVSPPATAPSATILAMVRNFRLTRRVAGKSTTETFDSPVALRKAQQEVAEFHRFQELSGEFVEVSEKICALRPVEDTLTPEEKKRPQAIHARSRAK